MIRDILFYLVLFCLSFLVGYIAGRLIRGAELTVRRRRNK